MKELCVITLTFLFTTTTVAAAATTTTVAATLDNWKIDFIFFQVWKWVLRERSIPFRMT
jgi:hypothetical protein